MILTTCKEKKKNKEKEMVTQKNLTKIEGETYRRKHVIELCKEKYNQIIDDATSPFQVSSYSNIFLSTKGKRLLLTHWCRMEWHDIHDIST